MMVLRNEVPELAKFADRYDCYMGYYYIPDTLITKAEVEEICATHTDKDYGYIWEDVFFNADGLPEVGVGSFCIGPKKWLDA